jgi:hypothetical protein
MRRRREQLVARVHPPLWPLFDDSKTPVLSVRRLARRAARKHPHRQGIVVSFTGCSGDLLDVRANGLFGVSLRGPRDRPYFVALDSGGNWIVRATVTSAEERDKFGKCEITIRDPKLGRVEWLHFSVEHRVLACAVTTVRTALPQIPIV